MPIKLKTLPSDPAKLQAMLEKLKDKEAKLEADLAIKTHPELRDGIISVVLAMSDLKRADRAVKISEKPEGEKKKRADMLKAQIRFYRNKLETLRESLKDLTEDSGGSYVRLDDDRQEALGRLREQFDKWEEDFKGKGVDLLELVPTLADFLGTPERK